MMVKQEKMHESRGDLWVGAEEKVLSAFDSLECDKSGRQRRYRMGYELEARIQALRKRSGLSVEKAAMQAGIAPSTLRRWENGVTQPRLPELNALLDALHTSSAEREAVLRFLTLPRSLAAQRELAAYADFLKPNVGRLDQNITGRTDLKDQDTDAYDQRSLAGTVGVQRKLSDHWKGSVAAGLEAVCMIRSPG